ncbi:hypothetical protein GGH92_002555 [Coemansia sp. RSA 2673]|nr:hypothetical protein GGH92_002555 [Coemansia sp. RSA 2673]
MPLPWICHSFYAFAFNRFCRKYVLNLCIEPDKYQVIRRSWPYCLEDLDYYPRNRFAKELEIRFHIWDIDTGKAFLQLSRAPHDGCAFPLVRELAFDFRFFDDSQLGDYVNLPPEINANILAFVQQVKEMVPSGQRNLSRMSDLTTLDH